MFYNGQIGNGSVYEKVIEIKYPGVVTETRSSFPGGQEIIEFAAQSGLRYCPRQDRSLSQILLDEGVSWIVVWEPRGPVLYQSEDRFFYHPSMGKSRVSRLRQGQSDPMVDAMGLCQGMKVLDCTLGLGADALVISYVIGKEGRIVGVESSPLIAYIVRWGIQKYSEGPKWLQEALSRIEIVCEDHYDLLKSQPNNSFDIVYFDPMFRQPISKSQPISPLRRLANHEPLSLEVLAEAARVTRKLVVVKERLDSNEFKRLGLKQIIAGKHSVISYGILNVEDSPYVV